MKASAKKILFSVIGLLVGFGLGYLCANLQFGEGNGKGDITKVSRFSKSVVSPQASAFQEKIMNDPEAFRQAKASLVLVSTRMNDFDNLVGFAKKSCEGIEELAPALEKVERISTLSTNAKKAAMEAAESFNSMIDNKKGAAADFETASQNLSLAYLMVDRQINVGKEFVSVVDSYLKGKSIEDNLSLATTRDLWAGYCAGQAVLDGDDEEMDFWSGQKNLVSESVLADASSVSRMGAIYNNETDFANIICLAINNNVMIEDIPSISAYPVVQLFHNSVLVQDMEALGFSRLKSAFVTLGANQQIVENQQILGAQSKIILASDVIGANIRLNDQAFLGAISQFGMGAQTILQNNQISTVNFASVLGSFNVIGSFAATE